MNQSFNSNSVTLNYKYESKPRYDNYNSHRVYNNRLDKNNRTIDNVKINDKFRLNNLENRISSLEKMLQYLDEFIHLKEEEKNNTNQNNLIVDKLNIKIDMLQKEIKVLNKENNENQQTIRELNNKIISLERQINNYNYNNMQDLIFSLSNKEKKLNMLINDFQDISKNTDLLINNKLTAKINEFNIFNENRIGELLSLIQNINQIIGQNELKITKINENIENIQKDNLNLIKIVSFQEQKFNNFELINNEINSIKEKIRILIDDYNNKLENKI